LDDPCFVEFHRLSRVVAIFTVLYLNHLALVVSTVAKNNVLLFVRLREREREREKRKGRWREREREREEREGGERERERERERSNMM
jgi:hypothetical protein